MALSLPEGDALMLCAPNNNITVQALDMHGSDTGGTADLDVEAVSCIRYNPDIRHREAAWMYGPGIRQAGERLCEPTREQAYPRVYFARAIDGEDSATRLALTSAVASELAAAGLSMVDPTADDPVRADETDVDEGEWYQTIVEHDLSVLRSCHAVLMDISVPGRSYIGCICEMTYAYFWHIPCVVYMGAIDNRRPWLQYHATAVFETRADAIDLLCRLLKRSPATR